MAAPLTITLKERKRNLAAQSDNLRDDFQLQFENLRLPAERLERSCAVAQTGAKIWSFISPLWKARKITPGGVASRLLQGLLRK